MSKFKRMEDRWADGDRTMLVMPLDMLILQECQPPGANVGGFYQIGTAVTEMRKSFPGIESSQIAGRVKVLETLGLTRSVRMVSNKGTVAWQRTQAGEEELSKWELSNNSTSNA